MKLLAFISAAFISGLFMGFTIDLPAWLQYPILLVCAVGTVTLYRILSAASNLSLWSGAAAGLFGGSLGAFFGTLISAFSGSVALAIVNATDDFDQIVKLIQDGLLFNLVGHSVAGLFGGILGAMLNRKLTFSAPRVSYTRKMAFNFVVCILSIVTALILPIYPQMRALLTLQKVDEFPLYVMHYSGNYGFSEVMQIGLEDSSYTFKSSAHACTAVAALHPEGNPIFGKNEDWHGRSTLLLFTDSPDGYASVSLVDLTVLGLHAGELEWMDRLLMLQAPYIPFDGLNEYGVAIASMTDYSGKAGVDPLKPTLGSLHLIRLVLDHAQSVDDAIALISQHNIDLRYGGAPPLHYLVADSSGSAAVIEFVDGETVFTRNEVPWQVATNFTVVGKSLAEAKAWCWRYKKAYEFLSQAEGNLTPEEMLWILEEVSQDNTRWSTVFDMRTGVVQLVLGKQYDHVFEFELDMKE